MSASVRDGLTDGLDVDVEDLGECFLKHVEEPVRAYRVGRPGPHPVMATRREYGAALQPTIAVIPFEGRLADPQLAAVGELITDGLIFRFSHAKHLRVISRLSTTALRGRDVDFATLDQQLRATYVLSGSGDPALADVLIDPF